MTLKHWFGLTVSFLVIAVLFTGCSINRVETSKSYYQQARQAQEAGDDLHAVPAWKKVLAQADHEIAAGHYLTTNYFMRASAHFELGEWDQGFADLKQVSPESLREEELWIYPLYAVEMGDYYGQKNMPLIARNFYQSVLKKSSLKSSSVYLLALERQINNSIRIINDEADTHKDSEDWKSKQYADLSKDLLKYIEDFPFSSVPHTLMGDLYLKQGMADDSLQYLMAALEMELPTQDLKRSTEFEVATLLSNYTISDALKSTLLNKAQQWWSHPSDAGILIFGEDTAAWALEQEGFPGSSASKIRYLAVKRESRWKILLWEPL